MSEAKHATGGDGWSTWTVNRTPTGGHEVLVISRVETRDGAPKVILHRETFGDIHDAISQANSASSAYAYRMFT